MKQNLQPIPLQKKALAENGLNLVAIFNLSDLDKLGKKQLENIVGDLAQYRQLILFGHAGRRMWEALQKANIESANPVDDFSIQTITQLFQNSYPDCNYQFIYPNHQSIGLQSLGMLAGWHHASPFKVGINQEWGSWFAYRAVLLADSHFALTPFNEQTSPCEKCPDKCCISRCPAKALEDVQFRLEKCIAYRKKENSLCRNNCLARYHCPVGQTHRYSDEQIFYHYSVSMKVIEDWG